MGLGGGGSRLFYAHVKSRVAIVVARQTHVHQGTPLAKQIAREVTMFTLPVSCCTLSK